MIETLKNSEGYIYAYVSWRVVDEKGHANLFGRYVHVNDIWVHEKYRDLGVMKALIKIIASHKSTKKAEYVYWTNRKNKRQTPLYNKWDILRLTGAKKETANA
jgi:hypothetical protein